MTPKMNGGMKMISADGTRVLGRDDPEINAWLLEHLKRATEVNIVSTESAFSLIVRVSLPDHLFRDDLIGEDDALMHGDARWLPTTGKPVREVILKFIVVSDPIARYDYASNMHYKSTMLQLDVDNEYTQQRTAFDATNHHVPLCPDVIALIQFPTRETFDEIFTKPKNKNYTNCRVFQKLRIYFSLPFKPQVAMIVMESIPATYVPLKSFKKGEIPHNLIAQICAMYVVLYNTCKMIALDAHRSNWLVDMTKPIPLRVKLIDYGMCLVRTKDKINDKISEIVDTYFKRHPTELQAYLTLMGATSDSPSIAMIKAIESVNVPIVPMESWIHKILVISMLIDGFFNMNHSTKRTTCQMKTVFNAVYNDACESMSDNILHTMRLDLPTYLTSQSHEKAQHTHEMLRNMALYVETYYNLRPRKGMESMDAGMATVQDTDPDMHDTVALARYGGKKATRKPKNARKTIKKRKSNKSNKPGYRRRSKTMY